MTKIYKLQRRIAIAYLDKNKRLWSKLQNELVNLEEAKIKAIKQIHKRKSSETSGIDKIVLKGSKGKKVSIDEILIQIQDLKNMTFLHKTCHRDRAALKNSNVKMDEPYEE
uniref:Reverse transcriptase N-terminal domain-containing protein n=1 Tax=Pyropia nitida TaxID=1682381 RepID=A0A0U2E2B5_9RHOD|nr:hypothetical protein [Pyropia nitida]AKQ53224.1 hypothetical protein [Pyropia nitida]